jgi:hypothetical protein
MTRSDRERKIWTAGTVLLSAVAAVMILAWSSCSATAAATRAVRGLQQARDLTAKQLAAMVRTRHLACLEKHGTRTPEYAACVKESRGWLVLWQDAIRPAADTSAAVGVAALQTEALVRKCKAEKNCLKVILAMMKPGACALARALKAFGHKLPDKGAGIASAVSVLGVVSCP